MFHIFIEGILSHSDLDERALDALKEFPVDGGVQVLKQFAESNLEHVGNKSAYLCGVMKTYRQKNKMPGGAAADAGAKKGPDEAKLKVSCVAALFVSAAACDLRIFVSWPDRATMV